ncbi:MAG: YdcF family protein [Motilibacteraceae bacterium]
MILFRLARRLLSLVLLLAVLAVVVTVGRVLWVGHSDDRRRSDAIVVLGAAQYDGRPQEVLRARLEHAAALLRAGVAPRIITVGGSRPGDRFTEAAAGRDYLNGQGIPSAQILAVETGSDTLDSMQAVAKAMRAHRWSTAVVVTDPEHSLRSRAMLRDAGVDAVTSPTRTGPDYGFAGEAHYVLRETGGYLWFEANRGVDSVESALGR